jgi:hypothetical protein
VTTIPTDAHAEAVIRDRVFVTTTDDDHDTVDASGSTVDLTLPGAPVHVAYNHLVVTTNGDPRHLSGYAVAA